MSELLAESFRELLLALANPAAVNDDVTFISNAINFDSTEVKLVGALSSRMDGPPHSPTEKLAAYCPQTTSLYAFVLWLFSYLDSPGPRDYRIYSGAGQRGVKSFFTNLAKFWVKKLSQLSEVAKESELRRLRDDELKLAALAGQRSAPASRSERGAPGKRRRSNQLASCVGEIA